jgi:hypothetical protein
MAKERAMSALAMAVGDRAAEEARRVVYADFLYGAGVPSAVDSWGVDLGRPVSYSRNWAWVTTPGCSRPQRVYDGVHRQEFERGAAIVNLSGEVRRVTLGQPYRDLDGDLRTSVTLAPRSGEVLVRLTA